jgi:hemolysin activation/secretion protein
VNQSIAIRAAVCLLTSLVSLGGVYAQTADEFRLYKDYDRYRYLPRLPQGNENPRPLPDTPRDVQGDPKVLVDELKGLIFVDHPDKLLEAEAAGDVRGVQFGTTSPLPLLRSASYQQIARSYLGGPISILRLNQLVRDTILFYRRADQPVVDVSVPEQDITSGVVQIVVTESRIGRVRVQGARYFDPQMLVDQVFLYPGQPIYESVLMEELRWLHRNPFRSVDLELVPGAQRGQTDVVFNVKDKLPLRLYTGYEDTGTRQTDLERIFAGVNWYNAFGQDDYFGYQYTANPQFDQFHAHSTFYSKALHNRDIITVYGTYADYTAHIPIFGSQPGTSWQILARWYRELEDVGTYQHGVTAGFDFKQVDGTLDFGLFNFGSMFDIAQFLVGYNGQQTDSLGSWNIGADAYYSPGYLSNHNTTGHFRQVRNSAEADYFYTRAFFTRRFWMPMQTEFVFRFTGQLSEANLLPTEQLAFGGYNSIRGYDQYAVGGDSGYFLNFEWWSRTIPIRCWGCGQQGSLRGLVFYDVGNAYNHSLAPGEDPSVDLQGVGFGFRYEVDPYVHVRFDFGQQLSDVVSARNYDHRVHLGVVLAY